MTNEKVKQAIIDILKENHKAEYDFPNGIWNGKQGINVMMTTYTADSTSVTDGSVSLVGIRNGKLIIESKDKYGVIFPNPLTRATFVVYMNILTELREVFKK